MIQAISFDCFGVLTQDGWLSFCSRYATDETWQELSDLNHQRDKGFTNHEVFVHEVSRITGAKEEIVDQAVRTVHAPNEQVFEVVRKLKAAGYTLGVLSNVGLELTHYLPAELLQLFNVVTHSFEIHAIKPDALAYEYHLSQLNVQANEVVFIDDRQSNVEGAQRLGIHGIRFTNAQTLIEALQNLEIRGL